MSYEKLNEQIIELVGGKENIQAVAHCVTRLRLTLKDRAAAKTEEIKELDGVIDVVSNEVAYQIIIGTHVMDVYAEFMAMLGLTPADNSPKADKPKGIKGIVGSILVVISETMTSIVEVLLAAGILAGIMAIFTLTGIVSAESPTYMIFDTLRGAVFHFLPVFIAASAAKRLHVNQYLAMVLAVTLLSSNIDGVEGLSIFGFQLQTIGYANTFIPIMLGVWFLGLAIKYLNKLIPKSLHYFLVPMLSLVITLPIILMIFGPIGTWIGNGLDAFFNLLMTTMGNWIVVTLYAATQPFLIVLGAANFTYPLVLNFLASLGYDPIFMAAATISDVAVCGTMVGYFLRASKGKEKQTFGTVSFSALMGITEPAIFGVFMKYRRPFLAVIIGGGAGGMIAGLAGVKTMGMVWGLAAMPTYLAGGVANFVWMLISVVVAFVIATVVAYGLGIPSSEKTTAELSEDEEPIISGDIQGLKQAAIGKIADGEVIALNEVSDQAFASGALGKGLGIIPSESQATVLSPVDGTITVVFPTKHAYGIRTESGIELLIHIGVDTVNLNGQFFESFVTQGQKVRKGEQLAVFEVDKIKEAGFDPTIMAVITNSNDYLDVISANANDADELLTVVF
ncbi:beta-glucoside-specific PTS transporter subunit IIABC [Enterococcus sp. BWR-S5]|uniref:beta-glucoside-specific PTS transporter subunit IIABC n=1 Tax=Enterococcus sp. BWR-S5 TaxID=2787714 RepID=UPI0019246A8F|nr:beta-glucoside-specific PTS transporter subunit IIABC [Enterococcus sp. BWR-S5]MBL1227313.1 PTS glucose transporter subunit IIA [Enterococcus sp. BWR-S5]